MNKKISSCFIVFWLLVMAVAFGTATEGGSKIGTLELKSKLPEPLFHVLDKSESVMIYVAKDDASGVALNPDQIFELKNSILNDHTYMFDLTKEVVFLPSVTFIFEYAHKKVVVSLSFHAEQIAFQYGEERIVLDCDPGFEKLNILSRSFFKESL